MVNKLLFNSSGKAAGGAVLGLTDVFAAEALAPGEGYEAGPGLPLAAVGVGRGGEMLRAEGAEQVGGLEAQRASEAELLGDGEIQIMPLRHFPGQGAHGGAIAVGEDHEQAVLPGEVHSVAQVCHPVPGGVVHIGLTESGVKSLVAGGGIQADLLDAV